MSKMSDIVIRETLSTRPKDRLFLKQLVPFVLQWNKSHSSDYGRTTWMSRELGIKFTVLRSQISRLRARYELVDLDHLVVLHQTTAWPAVPMTPTEGALAQIRNQLLITREALDMALNQINQLMMEKTDE